MTSSVEVMATEHEMEKLRRFTQRLLSDSNRSYEAWLRHHYPEYLAARSTP